METVVEVASAGYVPCLDQIDFRSVGVHDDPCAAHVVDVVDEFFAGLVVPCVVGSFADRPSEYLAQLGPVGDVVTLEYYPERRDREMPDLARVADIEQIGEVVPAFACEVCLIAEDRAVDRVDVLAGYQIVINPSFVVEEELEERAADALPFVVDKVFDEAVEPRGIDMFLHRLVEVPVALELYRRGEYRRFLLAQHGEEMSVEHDVGVQVDEFCAPRPVDELRLPDAVHVGGHVQPSAACGLEHDGLRRRAADIAASGDAFAFLFLFFCHVRIGCCVWGCCGFGTARLPLLPPARFRAARRRRCRPCARL